MVADQIANLDPRASFQSQPRMYNVPEDERYAVDRPEQRLNGSASSRRPGGRGGRRGDRGGAERPVTSRPSPSQSSSLGSRLGEPAQQQQRRQQQPGSLAARLGL